jgi:hypothetical protein
MSKQFLVRKKARNGQNTEGGILKKKMISVLKNWATFIGV